MWVVILGILLLIIFLIWRYFVKDNKLTKLKEDIKNKKESDAIIKRIKVCPADLTEKEKEKKIAAITRKLGFEEIIKREVKDDGYLYITIKISKTKALEDDKKSYLLLSVILFSVAVFLSFYKPSHNSSNSSDNSEQDNKELAYIYCQDWVKDRLVAPSTADFPLEPVDVTKKDDKYYVESYVDAQNSFGAKIRTKFICETKCDGRTWSLIDLEFSR